MFEVEVEEPSSTIVGSSSGSDECSSWMWLLDFVAVGLVVIGRRFLRNLVLSLTYDARPTRRLSK
jgi:hypothetical protein